jgi:steroid delta-isomerase-like uncharacterized protein
MTNTIFDKWFEELWNKGRIEIIDEMISPDCVVYRLDENGDDSIGPEAFKTFFRRFRSAFPDIKVTVEDAIEAGDRVAARFVFEATHSSDALGFAATGRRVRVTGMCWGVVRDGKIVHAWNNWDQMALARQLGLPPQSATART